MTLREQLKSAGLTDEQTASVEGIFHQQIAGEYIPKSRFDEVNEKNKELAKDVGRLESEKEAVEKRAKKAEEGIAPLQEKLTKTEEEWKKKYDDLDAGYKKKEQERIALETYNAKTGAVKAYLKDSAHDSDMVISLLDLDSLEIKDGKVLGVDKAVEALKKEKAFLFKDDSWESTAPTSAPKGEGGQSVSFGEALAKKASEMDAVTKAAAEKYFG